MTDRIRYLLAILQDGDYLNDWLTHVPIADRSDLLAEGMRLAHWIESALRFIGGSM